MRGGGELRLSEVCEDQPGREGWVSTSLGHLESSHHPSLSYHGAAPALRDAGHEVHDSREETDRQPDWLSSALQIQGEETSHWSQSIEILCSDWVRSWCCYDSSLMP